VNGDFVGEVPIAIIESPMKAFQAVVLSESNGMRYSLRNFAGRPSFSSLAAVTEFLLHDKKQVRAAHGKAGS
jgi:hypothetical protein